MNGFAPFFRGGIVHNRLFFVHIHVIPGFLHTSVQEFSQEDSVSGLFGALATPPLRVAVPSAASPAVPRWRCGLLEMSHKVFLLCNPGWTAPLHEGGLDVLLLAEVPVLLSGIACVAAYLLYVNPEEALVHLNAVL